MLDFLNSIIEFIFQDTDGLSYSIAPAIAAVGKMAGGMMGGGGGGGGGKGGGMMKGIARGAAAPISMAVGLGQMIAGAAQKKKAEKLMPGMEDPEQRAELEDVKQRMASATSGTDAMTAANLRNVDQCTAQTQNAISRNTGGDVGGTVSAMLQSQRTGDASANQVYGQARQQLPYFMTMKNSMLNNIAQRKLELGLLKHNQVQAQAEANKKSGFGNLMQGVMSSVGAGGKGGTQMQSPDVKVPTIPTKSSPMSTPQLQGREATAVDPQGPEVDQSKLPQAPSMSFGGGSKPF
jgi:hypothetical protein